MCTGDLVFASADVVHFDAETYIEIIETSPVNMSTSFSENVMLFQRERVVIV